MSDTDIHIDIVFDGPPGPDIPRLVEIDDARGRSIQIGTWTERAGGSWVLRITSDDFAKLSARG